MPFVRAMLIMLFLTAALHAQAAGGRLIPAAERVHPELVDSTWGPATKSAWEEAWDHNWRRASTMFDSLYRAHPDAVEALIGLGFVARGQLKYHEARRWWRRALEVDPGNKHVQEMLDIAEWDRPGRVELVERATNKNGQVLASRGIVTVVPISPVVTATWRAGVFRSADAFEQYFATPVDTGGPGHAWALGGVIRASERYTITSFYQKWVASGETDEYVIADIANRLSDHYVVHLTTRQTATGPAPTVWSVGFDWGFARSQQLTLRFAHATISTPIETQAQSRVIYIYAPPGHWAARAGLVIDSDPHLGAQTAYVSGNYFFTPRIGLRMDLVNRAGFESQRSIQGGIVSLW